jgi:hypothetical protein
MSINDHLREIAAKWRRKQVAKNGIAEPVTSDKLDDLIELLDAARDMVGSMPLSSKAMALHVSIYQAACVAKDFKSGGGLLP